MIYVSDGHDSRLIAESAAPPTMALTAHASRLYHTNTVEPPTCYRPPQIHIMCGLLSTSIENVPAHQIVHVASDRAGARYTGSARTALTAAGACAPHRDCVLASRQRHMRALT